MQAVVCLALAPFTIRKFVGGESFFVTRRLREPRGLFKIFRGAYVAMIFLFVETSERFVKLRPIWIIPDPALEEIYSRCALIRKASRGCARSFSAATLAFQAMCHAAMSQNKIPRGCKVVTSRNRRRTRPHSARSHATWAWIKRTSATSERNPLTAARKPSCPICSRNFTARSSEDFRPPARGGNQAEDDL